jgi:hypothetical protein
MNMPGFNADRSVGPAKGIYRGTVMAAGSADIHGLGSLAPEPPHRVIEGGWEAPTTLVPALAPRIPLPLARSQECTITHSGFVTFPVKICRPPFLPPGQGAGTIGTDPGSGGLSGTTSGLSERSAVARFGDAHFATPPHFCRISNGPWLADIEQHTSCNIFQPDHFVLSIQGTPQPISFEWNGTLEDAPAEIGSLGNLSTSLPSCSCCPGLKQCPNGDCVPQSSKCDNGIPA